MRPFLLGSGLGYMEQESASKNDIRYSAMNLLAMREHSVKELKHKLGRNFSPEELVDEVIRSLTELGLQSDERFAQAFVAMRQRQGKGSVVIKLELREKGVNSDLIGYFVDEGDAVWCELARKAWAKKFRGGVPQDSRERAKQMRFLQGRGFTGSQIKAIFIDNIDES